jgi:hypothetical protein
MTDVFISYKREDRGRCIEIADALRALGLDVWVDARLESGVSFDAEIESRIHAAKAVLVLWSPLAVQSSWVRNEATIGLERGVLVSAELEPCRRPVQFTTTHTEMLHGAALNESSAAWMGIVRRIGVLAGRDDLVAGADKALPAAARGAAHASHFAKKKSAALPIGLAIAALVIGVGAVAYLRPTPDQPKAMIPGAEASSTPSAAPAPSISAPPIAAPADPCAQARGDWASLAASTDVALLQAFLASTPADCPIQRGLAEAKLKEIEAAAAEKNKPVFAAAAVAKAFAGAWVAVPGEGGECAMLPWRFERTDAGYDRISSGGDREPFTVASAAPPTLRHSGGLRIMVRGDRMDVVPGDNRAPCKLQRQG